MDDMQGINVEEIMQRVRENIRQQHGDSPVGALDPSSTHPVTADLAALENTQDIYHLHFTSHRKLLGPIIIFAKKVVRQLLTPSLERQSGYNAANNRMALKLWQQVEALEEFSRGLAAQISQVKQEKIAAIQTLSTELSEQVGGIHHEQIAGLQALRREMLEELGGLHQRQVTGQQTVRREMMERIQGAADQLGDVRQQQESGMQALRVELNQQVAGVRQEQVVTLEAFRDQLSAQLAQRQQEHAALLQAMRERCAGVERKLRRLLYSLTESQEINGSGGAASGQRPRAQVARNSELYFDYFGFEERFRGSEEDIKQRQSIYIEYFKEAEQVLDLGCGRGEFLELLAAAGIKAKGVDLDLDMVLCCQEKGLDVVGEDAFAYLEAMPDDSLGGLFAAQVIEHLEAQRIIELVKLCQRKLQVGGTLIFETPNPTCLAVFARSFYMDFSHIKPIHPEAVRFLFESSGFRDVQVKFSSPVEPSMRIPPLPVATANGNMVEEFNQGLERLNDLLYGFQDYAVIGRKTPHF
jgi:O-antigen chain-terminating methyltransferase